MSASRMIFEIPPGRLDVDDAGRITAVRVGDRPYLSGGGVAEVIIGGESRRPSVARVAVDADEIDVDLELAEGLGVAVRHSFAAGWGWRVRLSNTSAEELIIDAVRLELTAANGMIGHRVAAEAEAELIIRPGDGGGPILAGRLITGAVTEITDTGLITGPIRLAPGAGYVLTWHWTWYDSSAKLAERRRGLVPWPTVRTVGEPIDLRGDPDAALIVPEDLIGADGMIRGPGGELTELVADRPGSFPIEERSARGTVAFSLGWAPPLDRVLGERAEKSSTGAASDGLLLHAALTAGTVADPDRVTDALEIIAGELIEAGPETGLGAVLLCLEHHRTGETDPLNAAVAWILRQDRIVPGFGFAVAQACLGQVVRGRPIAPIIQRASTLAVEVPERARLPLDADGIAELELLAAMHRNSERPAPALRSRLLAAGPYLGAGEVGPARPPLPVADQAALIAVVLFAKDQALSIVGRDWAASPAMLAEVSLGYLIDEVAADPASEIGGWLAVARVAS